MKWNETGRRSQKARPDSPPLISTLAEAAPVRDGILRLQPNEGVILTLAG